jgi:hypothetical protein
MKEQTDAMEKQARFENSFQEYASQMLTTSGKEVSWVMYAHAFNAGYAAALEAGKAVDEKPEPDAMSTEDHINEIRSARKLTLADYGLVIHND